MGSGLLHVWGKQRPRHCAQAFWSSCLLLHSAGDVMRAPELNYAHWGRVGGACRAAMRCAGQRASMRKTGLRGDAWTLRNRQSFAGPRLRALEAGSNSTQRCGCAEHRSVKGQGPAAQRVASQTRAPETLTEGAVPTCHSVYTGHLTHPTSFTHSISQSRSGHSDPLPGHSNPLPRSSRSAHCLAPLPLTIDR